MVLCPDRPSCNSAEQSGREKLPCKPSYQTFFKLTLQPVIAAARACGRQAECVSLKNLKSGERHVDSVRNFFELSITCVVQLARAARVVGCAHAQLQPRPGRDHFAGQRSRSTTDQ